MIDEIEAF